MSPAHVRQFGVSASPGPPLSESLPSSQVIVRLSLAHSYCRVLCYNYCNCFGNNNNTIKLHTNLPKTHNYKLRWKYSLNLKHSMIVHPPTHTSTDTTLDHHQPTTPRNRALPLGLLAFVVHRIYKHTQHMPPPRPLIAEAKESRKDLFPVRSSLGQRWCNCLLSVTRASSSLLHDES